MRRVYSCKYVRPRRVFPVSEGLNWINSSNKPTSTAAGLLSPKTRFVKAQYPFVRVACT